MTRLVVSIGGNDALSHIDLLSLRVTSSAQALATFASRLDGFERSYRDAIKAVAGALGVVPTRAPSAVWATAKG